MKSKPVISVKEARRLLGKEVRDLSDFQILEIINALSDISKDNMKRRVKKIRRTLGL